MDYSTLVDLVRSCKTCPLGVKGVGVPGAFFENGSRTGPLDYVDLMIIAEAPGDVEQDQGWPVMGSSGELMHAMLNEVGVTFYYVTNVAKHRPWKVRGKQQPPDSVAIKACSPYLDLEFAMIRPTRLILLGKTAAKLALPGNISIGKEVGTTVEYRGLPTLILYHPAYFLYNRTSRWVNKGMKDWKKAVRVFIGERPAEYKVKEVKCEIHN
ncbi:hypothetical protein LCGC14_1614170 [marine sediment metagenome]|uniref:Uracil-DNA glycosylase-like domain-containing protein n=1 Tax=marine sediment metagenome TaxID=412755 RepID=A0A0F9I7Q5_9ZZZZ